MYLSIGNDMAVRDSSILGIFDLDNTSTSKRTRAFLEAAEKEGQVVPCDDLPKSFVLTEEYGFDRVYLTSLSAGTLETGTVRVSLGFDTTSGQIDAFLRASAKLPSVR